MNPKNNPQNEHFLPFLGKYSQFLSSSIFVVVIFGNLLLSTPVQAGFFSFLGIGEDANAESISNDDNSQTIDLPKAVINPIVVGLQGKNTTDDILEETDSLVAHIGPLGNKAEAESRSFDTISVYVVKKGDTLPKIAEMFDVSVNTVRYANDLNIKDKIKEGDVLTILPITGINHTVKKGDTVKTIAKKYSGDVNEIAVFNGIEINEKLAIGDEIIIPDGEEGTIITPVKSVANKGSNTKTGTSSNKNLPIVAYGKTRLIQGHDGPEYTGYFVRPVHGGKVTQDLHGWNGVDIGAPLNTPVYAAAGGVVIAAKNNCNPKPSCKQGGWNTGFGNYIVIKHDNGTQTLYGHLNEVLVTMGQSVGKNEQIGLLGSTGRSTGSHLHFEVRGAKNPLGNGNYNFGL